MTLKNRCQEFSRRGTGFGVCDGPLDEHEQCGRAGQHISREDANVLMGATSAVRRPIESSGHETRSRAESTP